MTKEDNLFTPTKTFNYPCSEALVVHFLLFLISTRRGYTRGEYPTRASLKSPFTERHLQAPKGTCVQVEKETRICLVCDRF